MVNVEALFNAGVQEVDIIPQVFIAMGKDPDFVSKVSPKYRLVVLHDYAAERDRLITTAVRALNKLCNMKSKFDSSWIYRVSRLSFESLVKPYTILKRGDRLSKEYPAHCYERLDKCCNRALDPSLELIRLALNSYETDLIHVLLYDLLEHVCSLDLVGPPEDRKQKAEERMEHRLLELQEFFSTSEFQAQGKIACSEICAYVLKCPKTEDLAQYLFGLRFQAWQYRKIQFHEDARYARYAQQRQIVQQAFREIEAFCTVQEAQKHPKIQNDAALKVAKYLKPTIG